MKRVLIYPRPYDWKFGGMLVIILITGVGSASSV